MSGDKNLLNMSSQLVGVLAAASQDGANADSLQTGKWVAENSTQYNNLNHPQANELLNEIEACKASGKCSEDKFKKILVKYEEISAQRSAAIGNCPTRQCVDAVVNSAIAMSEPVAQALLSLLRQTTYDVPGLLNGNPSLVTAQTPNPSGWGDIFALDKQLAFAKSLKEGWLTPAETADLDRWNASTSWLDQATGRQLDVKQKAAILTELSTTGALALIGGRGAVGGAVYKTNKEAKVAAELLVSRRLMRLFMAGKLFLGGVIISLQEILMVTMEVLGKWPIQLRLLVVGKRELELSMLI